MIRWRELIKRVKVYTSVLIIVFGVSCQQVKEIPEEIPEQLPNPVRDFTQNDRYVIGLNWYRQGDYNIAAKFWKLLAAEEDCDAQYAMGLLYFEGLGVGRSYGRAVDLWEKSAEQGQAQAQISLGVVYARISIPYTTLDCKRGCGEAKNLVKGYKWFGVARGIGSPHEMKVANDSMSRIVPEMTPEELSKGEDLVHAWKPDPMNCDPREMYIVGP